MTMDHKAKLEEHKRILRELNEKFLAIDPIEDIEDNIKKIFETINQITGRAEMSEDRILELEMWAPQTVDFSCPKCQHKTQFNMSGSNWWREKVNLQQEQIKTLEKEIANLKIKNEPLIDVEIEIEKEKEKENKDE